jgi:hypothetical protein
MQLVEEGDEGLAADRPDGAPLAPAEFRARRRIEEDLVVAYLVQAPRRLVAPALDAERKGAARLGDERHEDDPHSRIAALDLLRQRERRQSGTLGPGFGQVRVEPCVELVIPRDHRAGESADEQEAGDREPRQAVQADRDGPKTGLHHL